MVALITIGTLPAVQLRGADGACATITLFGAHLVSWTTADGAEQLFCSQRSSLDGSRAIRGGVPVIFPQFNERGPIMRHGFARTSTWTLADSGADDAGAYAVFALAPSDLAPARRAEWPHEFTLRLRVQLGAAQLTMTLDVDNTGSAPLAFSAALHTYHRVQDAAAVRIDGVTDGALAIGDALDAIYHGIGAVIVHDGVRRVHSTQQGFVDAVVWNPGAAASAGMADMAADDYHHFVCVEPAVIAPVTVQAGGSWRGMNILRIESSKS